MEVRPRPPCQVSCAKVAPRCYMILGALPLGIKTSLHKYIACARSIAQNTGLWCHSTAHHSIHSGTQSTPWWRGSRLAQPLRRSAHHVILLAPSCLVACVKPPHPGRECGLRIHSPQLVMRPVAIIHSKVPKRKLSAPPAVVTLPR